MTPLGSASWPAVSAVAGAVAALAAAVTLLVLLLRGIRAEVRDLGTSVGRRMGKLDKRMRLIELAAAARDAREAERAAHQATQGWVAGHVEEAIRKHADGCRARELEEVSGVRPAPHAFGGPQP